MEYKILPTRNWQAQNPPRSTKTSTILFSTTPIRLVTRPERIKRLIMGKLNAVIYDCEIINAIPPSKQAERLPNINYCEGWKDFKNMGISVIGMYDYLDDRYRIFCQDNFQAFAERLDSARIVVDFNGYNFDKPLMEASGIPSLLLEGLDELEFPYHYDILREIWKADGNDPDIFDKNTHSGYGLDACAKANFDIKKTGHGAQAPIDWQEGRIGNVIDYCLNDVIITKRLFDRILKDGFIVNPKDPARIIKMPYFTKIYN
ncbi:ribonuclease H-like domain-containing protein [Thiolinea disciformis]|uniref:ribonuclease H-like domain-containing protein n=1 Tax=Thiolinea disciformis TaxID=125614 RepID=UPI0012FEAF6E|nr:ribonuclease H-like domain-containing protein [Thiolinea disciformis]